MAAKQTVLTQEGLNALEAELENLKTVKRKDIAEKIKVALSFGDLSENSEYDEAKNEQGIIEARIAEIEATLKNVKVIDDIALNTPFTPVIPHIDRYFHTFTPVKYIEHFFNMPVIIQMNAIYINGVHNTQFYKPLIESGKIKILGSDCHSAEWRQPDLGQAVERLKEVCSDEAFSRIDSFGREMLRDAVYQDL